MKPVRIGTRESILAVIQSELFGGYLAESGIEYELVKMKTTGDKILNKTLDKIGGKGLFVKELDLHFFLFKIESYSTQSVPVT